MAYNASRIIAGAIKVPHTYKGRIMRNIMPLT